MSSTFRSGSPVLVLGLVAAAIYFVHLVVTRLYLSPVAKFPGPKLAALSRWYEFYYDVILKGQYTFHIQDLHRQYGKVDLFNPADHGPLTESAGPIVRISPYEVHIDDPDFYDTLFSHNGRREKYSWTDGRLGNPLSFFGTSNHDLHRMRREPFNSMFSKRHIHTFEAVIDERLQTLLRIFIGYKESGKAIPLDLAFCAYSQDVICEFAFARSFHSIESPDFSDTLHDAYKAATQVSHLALQFPWLLPTLKMLPDWLAMKMNPEMSKLIILQQRLGEQVQEIKSGKNDAYKSAVHPTIFHEILESDLPPQEKTTDRMEQEAQNIIGAGLVTTSWALAVSSYHIISTPAVYEALHDELIKAIPDLTKIPSWAQLEKLPYLSGCVYEALRLSYGVTARQIRVAPEETLNYKDWEIPAGTPISQSIFDINHTESIYPDSHSFIPERWIGKNRVPERYFVTFSKGTRMCIGLNLAYAEIYKALAMIFRRFSFELHHTDISDVKLRHDFFLPYPKLDSKGIRAKLTSVDGEPVKLVS